MSEERFDVVIVGAGMSGLYMLHQTRKLGLSAIVLEAGGGVGGTWYWNRYPGARCDVESLDYSFSFDPELEQEWEWTERYPTQPEIRTYLEHVAERFDLMRDIRLDTRVKALKWDEDATTWTATAEDGFVVTAQYCVLATGCLTVPNRPLIPGLDDFAGDTFHTARWPQEGVDMTGRRVGVIGTGSTSIQLTTKVAPDVEHMTVFQRTPNFSLPAFNRSLDAEHIREVKADYPQRRDIARNNPVGIAMPLNEKTFDEMTRSELEAELEARWQIGGFRILGAVADLLLSKEANDVAVEFTHRKIAEKVDDPATAEKLKPIDHPFATKRICVDSGYYEIYNRPNVDLVDLRAEPIEQILPTGLRTEAGEYAFDTLILATGYDAMTGAIKGIEITGVDGRSLNDAWAEGPRSYLGLCSHGFPNLFLVTGPGSPSVLSNMITSIEQHIEWITGCLAWMQEHGHGRIEATAEAEDEWTAHVVELAGMTLHKDTRTWYNGSNIPGKLRIFMPYVGGVGAYRERCDEIAAAGYEGFAFGGRVPAPA